MNTRLITRTSLALRNKCKKTSLVHFLNFGSSLTCSIQHQSYHQCLNVLTKHQTHKREHSTRSETKHDEQSVSENKQQTTESYTKILKKFFLRVHPDFFHSDPAKQEQNKTSFSKLNELLGWSNEYMNLGLDKKDISEEERADLEQRLHRLGPIPCMDETFTFYVKDSQSKKEPFKIEVLFSLPKKVQFNGKLKSRLVITQRLEELVTTLLEKSQIITADEAKRRRDAAVEQFKEYEESSGTNKKTYKSLKEELRLALQNNLQGSNNLEKLRRGEEDDEDWWWDKDLPTIEHLVKNNMLFFSNKLSAEQTIQAVNKLKDGLNEMRYYEWSDMPLMVTEKPSYGVNDPADGFICIPYNFTPFEFGKNILDNKKNMDILLEKRSLTRKKAEAIENMRERLIEEVGLSDLSISPQLTSEQLYTFVENFENRYLKNDKLKYVLKDLCLIVDTKYTASPDGYISIRWDFMDNGQDRFIQFLKDIGAQKLKNIKDMGKTLGSLKNSCIVLGREIIEKLKCKEFNMTLYADLGENPLSKHETLPVTHEYLQRLRESCLFLERYDWTYYNFYLVNTLSMPKGYRLPLQEVPLVESEVELKALHRRIRIFGDSVIDMGTKSVYIPLNFEPNQLFECVKSHWKHVEKPQLALVNEDEYAEVVDPKGFQMYRTFASELVKTAEKILKKKRADRYKLLAEHLNNLEDLQLYGKGTKNLMEVALDSPEDERFVELFRTWFRIRDVPLDVFETN